MLRSSFVALSAIFLTFTCVSAEDYLLRIETTGFRDRPQREREPTPEILESTEIIARVNQPFYGITTMGKEKISIRGILEQMQDGGLRVQVWYSKSKDPGESIPVPNGQKNPVAESTGIRTTTMVELQKAVELGGVDKSVRGPDGTALRTKTRTVLSLVKYDPARN